MISIRARRGSRRSTNATSRRLSPLCGRRHPMVCRRRPRLRKHRTPKTMETTDRNNPGIKYGINETPVPQNPAYLVLSQEERAKGFVRPYRRSYWHKTCAMVTTMSQAIAETYARNPKFYGATYC